MTSQSPITRASIRPPAAGVVDRAAAVFARHGFAHTSVQAIANATGYSKAGLLHHFASKEAIYQAAIAECRDQIGRIHGKVSSLSGGRERDVFAVELLVDLALAQPGLVALLLAASTPLDPDFEAGEFESIAARLFSLFDVEDVVPNLSRYIGVLGALGALGLTTLNAQQVDEGTAWRAHIIRTTVAALGHQAT